MAYSMEKDINPETGYVMDCADPAGILSPAQKAEQFEADRIHNQRFDDMALMIQGKLPPRVED